VGGDCQLAYVSVELSGEMALLADGYHSGDGGLGNGDQDRSVLAGGRGEGVGEPLLRSLDGSLVIPPGRDSFCQPRGELQDRWPVVITGGTDMEVFAIHGSSMPRKPFYKKAIREICCKVSVSCQDLFIQAYVIDVVGEVDHDAFGVHSERGGHELGVHGVDQVGQPGAAEHPGRDAARVEHVADIGD